MLACSTMVTIEPAQGQEDLQAILRLQSLNLPDIVGEQALSRRGFVSVRHDLELLERLHEKTPHIIARGEDGIAGYALGMSPAFSDSVDMLRGMFARVEQINKDDVEYIVCGQICVAQEYRGQGIFRGLYDAMATHYSADYDAIVTAIDTRNARSLNAHTAVGFESRLRFLDSGREWELVWRELLRR